MERSGPTISTKKIKYLQKALLPTIENTVVTVGIIILLPHVEEKVAGKHPVQSMEIGVDGYCEVGGRYLREVPVLFVLVLAQSVEQIEHLGQEGGDLGG